MNPGGSMADAWTLARGAPGWEGRLDMSAGAVFGSFWAVPLSLPAIALVHEVQRRAQLQEPGLADALASVSPVLVGVAAMVGALGAWAGSLLVLTALTRRSASVEGWRVSPLLVGYNWSRLLANLVVGLAAAVAVGTGVLPLYAVGAAFGAGLALFLDIGIIRHALGLTLGRALGVFLVVLLARGVGMTLSGLILALGGAVPVAT